MYSLGIAEVPRSGGEPIHAVAEPPRSLAFDEPRVEGISRGFGVELSRDGRVGPVRIDEVKVVRLKKGLADDRAVVHLLVR